MAKMVGMNKNYKEVGGVLRTFEGGAAFAREVFEKMEGRTFNSVNATLAAMATKGYVSKEKAVYGEGENAKMLTRYTLTEAGITELDKPEETPAETEDAE